LIFSGGAVAVRVRTGLGDGPFGDTGPLATGVVTDPVGLSGGDVAAVVEGAGFGS
jgi:hypothetical protein